MDNSCMGIVLIIFIILLIKKSQIKEFMTITKTVSNIDKKQYNVIGGFKNTDIAADNMALLHLFIINILRHLKKKYILQPTNNVKMKDFTRRILNNYNRDVLIENDPAPGEETSYILNKGSKFGVCLREKNLDRNFHDYNTLQFVILHEITHLGTISYGHNEEFWNNFKLLLIEAKASGLYKPINYAIHPIVYCGIKVTDNPYFT